MDFGLQHSSCFPCLKKYSKAAEALLCLCLPIERFLPELCLRAKLSLNSAKLLWIFHCLIIYLKDQLAHHHSTALEKSNFSCSSDER